MRLGNTDIASVKLGSSQVQAVYLGNNLVWQNAPVAIAATGVGTTSFTANWEAFTGATYYLLDVSESSDFSTFVYENQFTTSTSYVVIGLESNTTYYYRVRASDDDLDALAFFERVDAATGVPNSLSITEKNAIDTLVKQFKLYGIWAKMKAIYPFVGGGIGTLAQRQAACSQNLKSSSFTGTFTATGWTFASTGVTSDGTAFMQTGISPLNNLTNGNFHLSCYCNIVSTQQQFSNDITIGKSAYNPLGWVALRVNNKSQGIASFAAGDDNISTSASSTTAGFAVGTETSNSLRKLIKNNSILATNTTLNTTALDVNQLCLAGFTAQNFSLNRNAFTSIGDGLLDDEAGFLYNAVQNFQVTLNRAVI